MAEEQKWPGAGHSLCANNCGFFGSPTTLNLCSKCYKDHCIKEQQMKEAKITMENSLTHAESSNTPSSSNQLMLQSPSSDVILNLPRAADTAPVDSFSASINTPMDKENEAPVAATGSNRCSTCRKRVGLTGFKCKCVLIFCGSHRYPENHGCTFDYKASGREAIAKANPVVKGKKLDKI